MAIQVREVDDPEVLAANALAREILLMLVDQPTLGPTALIVALSQIIMGMSESIEEQRQLTEEACKGILANVAFAQNRILVEASQKEKH